MVTADAGKLRQILMNLLSNAIKFTAVGSVTMRVKVVNNSAAPRDGEPADGVKITLHVEVSDTGPGIAPAEREQIFNPFVQAGNGQAAQEGTGLGLSISRQFARLMDGDLTVQSEPGRGSTFTLVMPVRIAPVVVPAEEPQRLVVGLAPGQPPYRLLVVDDSETNRRLLVRLLEPLGFTLREATNGQEAVAIWQERL
jgi:hypothetical protein